MILTDKTVTDLIKKADSAELEYRIHIMTDEDREGRTDIEILTDEIDWLLYLYSEDSDSDYYYDLKEARSLIRKTDDGKRIPISIETFRPLKGYTQPEIEYARLIIAEYKRIKTVANKLAKLA